MTSGPPSRGGLVALAAALVAWNATVNLVALGDVAYVVANLALAGALSALARRWGLGREALGWSRSNLARGLRVGVVAMALIGVVVLAAWAVPATRVVLADQRVADLGAAGITYWALVRIPLGTALAEEVVFRSVLLAAVAARAGWRRGVLWSSGVFGLWHIGPSLVALRVNELTADPLWTAVAVAAAVGVTFIGGLGFCALRWWAGHVIAPTLAHVATNVFSLLAAAAVLRAA